MHLLDVGEQRDRAVDHPAVDVDDLAGALRDVEEPVRHHQVVAVAEPDQGLGAGDPAGADVEDRLQLQDEVVVVDRLLDPLGPRHPGAHARLLVVVVVEEDVLVAPRLLGVVHGHVGGRDQVLERRLPVADQHHADARGHPAQHALVRLGEAAHPLQDVLRHEPGSGRVGGRQQERELVATDPRDQVARACALAQQRRDGHDQLVTDMVAERVVDLLEVVQVEHQERTLGVALAVLEVHPQVGFEPASVDQAGQWVVVGQVRHPLRVPVALADVDEVHEHERLVVGVHQRARQREVHDGTRGSHGQPLGLVAFDVEDGGEVLREHVRLVRVRQLRQVPAHQVTRRHVQEPSRRRVRVVHHPGRVQQQDADR